MVYWGSYDKEREYKKVWKHLCMWCMKNVKMYEKMFKNVCMKKKIYVRWRERGAIEKSQQKRAQKRAEK